MLLIACSILMIPAVQTHFGKYATELLKKEFNVDITVERVAINPFGGVKLNGVYVKDHHNDTLAYFKNLNTHILDFGKLYDPGHPYFDQLTANELNFKIVQYKGEKDTNLDVFVAKFDDGSTKSSGKFRMKINSLLFRNSRFRYIDENLETPKFLDFTNLNGQLDDFFVKGSSVYAYVYKLKFKDHRGMEVKELTSDFTYTVKNILLNNLKLETENSKLTGRTELIYNRKDFADFNNKVVFDFDIKEGNIATNDLNCFYPEFGKNQMVYLDSHIKGTLNDLNFKNLKLLDTNGNEVIGQLNLKNLFGKKEKNQEFYMKGNFDRLSASQENIGKFLPSILGKNLPKQLQKLGKVDLSGDVELTTKKISADIDMYSKLGRVTGDFSIDGLENIDKAKYNGLVKLDNFDLGNFTEQKDLGKVTLNLDINGVGFSQKYLNTNLKGGIGSIKYNGYTFKNIEVDGTMKMPYFKGKFASNDPNLKMKFDGLLDLSKNRKVYDFKASVEYADLNKINLYKKDKISIISGNISINANGNSLETIAGTIDLKNISYTNQKDNYFFENAYITSSFDSNNVRTLNFKSNDLIEGKVIGKYRYKEIPKIVQNAVGSLYANYSPHRLQKNQFLDFDITVYNKIFELFYPDISVAENTHLKGTINADQGLFKLDLKSSLVEYDNNKFNNLDIDIDNKNPLYNTYIQMDSINTKSYKISKFNLINLTVNDTLFIRTEFNGGKKEDDKFNLNLYHTIDQNKQSVVGFNKSEVLFKNYEWFINENNNRDNRVVFDKKFKNFDFNKLTVSHKGQFVDFSGQMRDSTYKNFKFRINDVDLSKVTPEFEDFTINGKINGDIFYLQENSFFQPSTDLTVSNLIFNDIDLGDMDLKISGDENFKKFNINARLIKNEEENFNTNGFVEFINKKPVLDLDANFKNFDIKPVGGFLKGIVENFRGIASGRATIVGPLEKPEIDGILYLNNSGLKIPVLNVDYDFGQNSILDVTENKFIFREFEISDKNEKTSGILQGEIVHKKLSNWDLNLRIDSDNILVLDTKDSEEAYYYGKAYFDGFAEISGPVEALVISANGSSQKGTDIKIPVIDAETSGGIDYVQFVTKDDKDKTKINTQKTYQGIDLDFYFDINENALIEVILNKETGHSMKGRGLGTLNLSINTLGKFEMNGDFRILKGDYFFRYGNLFRKTFAVKPGGTINWTGDPLGAELNLEAVYLTQANPGILTESSSFNRKVPTEVSILINGNLKNPQSDFDIKFPSVQSTLKSEIDYQLQNKDLRQKQAFALLSTGNFTSPQNIEIYGSFLETARNIFGELISEGENKFNVGIDYQIGDRQREITDRAIVTLNTEISNKVSFNGNVGVPVGGIAQSYIIGNAELEIRLNTTGTLSLLIFNRENDINYNTIGQNVGYTQGLGIKYDVDFDTFKELVQSFINSFENKAKTDRKTEKNKKTDDSDNNEINPDFKMILDQQKRKLKSKDEEDKEKKENPKKELEIEY